LNSGCFDPPHRIIGLQPIKVSIVFVLQVVRYELMYDHADGVWCTCGRGKLQSKGKRGKRIRQLIYTMLDRSMERGCAFLRISPFDLLSTFGASALGLEPGRSAVRYGLQRAGELWTCSLRGGVVG